jgi:hypothetical protein
MHNPLNRSALLRAQGRVRSCAACGRPLRQANAKKKFCSDRCRQVGHRQQKWDGQFDRSRSAGPNPSALSRFLENSSLNSGICKADLTRLAYSIIGPPEVIEIEIGPSRQLTCETQVSEVVEVDQPISADLEIPDNLSIPPFLKRELGS